MRSFALKLIPLALCLVVVNAQYPYGGPQSSAGAAFPSQSQSYGAQYPYTGQSAAGIGSAYPTQAQSYGAYPGSSAGVNSAQTLPNLSGQHAASGNPNMRIFGLLGGGGGRGGGLFGNLLGALTGNNANSAAPFPYPVPVPAYPYAGLGGLGGGGLGGFPGYGPGYGYYG